MPTKVLVFESDAVFAEELRGALGPLGFSVRLVDDGNAGLAAAAAERPDLILLSIELPRMNGFSVCNKLKKDPALKAVPLIIMSSESSDETFEQHRKLRTRAEDYLHKPVSTAALLDRIRVLLPDLSASGGDGSPDSSGDDDGLLDEGSIVIDEDIQVVDSLSMGGSSIPPPFAPLSAPALSVSAGSLSPLSHVPTFRDALPSSLSIDEEVDAFAENAFGRLLDEGRDVFDAPAANADEPPTSPTMLAAPSFPPPSFAEAEERPASSSSFPAPRVSSLPPFPSAPPPGARLASVPPPMPMPQRGSVPPRPTVDHAEVERLRGELDRQRAEVARLERELGQTRAEVLRLEEGQAQSASSSSEVSRLQREIDDLKIKGASGARPSAVSSREFLDLREALNKKDKEILGLRDQLSRKDKELLDGNDTTLALERVKADLEDRIDILERELVGSRSQAESLAADKEQASKRADDYKHRAEKLKGELDAKSADLIATRQKQAEELSERDARAADQMSQHEAFLDALREEQARLLSEAARGAEVARDEAVARARSEESVARAEALELSRREAEKVRHEAVATREAELRTAHTNHIDELARVHEERAHAVEGELSQARDELREAVSNHETQLARLAREREVALAEQVASLEKQREAALAHLRAELNGAHEDAAETLRSSLTEANRLEVVRLEDEQVQRVRELEGRHAATVSELDGKIHDLDGRLSALIEERANLSSELSEVRARAVQLDGDLHSTRTDLSGARDRLADMSQRAERAVAKWGTTRSSLELVKDALAAALTQVEEVEARGIE